MTIASEALAKRVRPLLARRQGIVEKRMFGGTAFMRITWPCKDGFVNLQFSGGASSGQSVNNFVRWMRDDGMPDEYMETLDFKILRYGTVTKEMLDRIVPPVASFLMQRTKQQLFEGAIERRVLLFPVATPGDILTNPHLEARGFFQSVEHPELDVPLTMPGPFVRASATPVTLRQFAPKLGQHNAQIYGSELGIAAADLVRLREAGAI